MFIYSLHKIIKLYHEYIEYRKCVVLVLKVDFSIFVINRIWAVNWSLKLSKLVFMSKGHIGLGWWDGRHNKAHTIYLKNVLKYIVFTIYL